MKPAFQAIRVLILSTLLLGTARAQLVPPQQDYYLNFYQVPYDVPVVDPFWREANAFAWVDTPGDLIVSNALTVEAWVLWDGSDFDEIQLESGKDMDVVSLLCGQRAYGFQRRLNGAEGWSFFLQTDSELYPDTGLIPVPQSEWAHIAATYDGATIRTFLNGVQQTEVGSVSGNIPTLGGGFFLPQCTYTWDGGGEGPPTEILSIGPGEGFTGGMRQLRVWNRALPEAELLANAGLQLAGTESGLVGYWPLNGPDESIQAQNMVPGGPPLLLGWNDPSQRPLWRKTDPLFVVREDLAEDVLVSDCPSLPVDYGGLEVTWLVDAQDDGDLDLIFTGGTGDCNTGLTPFRALIRDGDNGFVFDTPGAIAGTVPSAGAGMRTASADFNGDGRLDAFSGNPGEDWCVGEGATNTLLLSRPDGLLEDASDNLLGPPCNADSPQFEGQHMCFAGGGAFGKIPGIRYPGTGEAVTPDPAFTHGVASGDTDGDGDVDILVGNIPHHDLEEPYLLINDGQGGFLANWQLLPGYVYGQYVDGRASPNGYLLDDLDEDGHVDLVVAPNTNPITQEFITGIAWNDGTGDFSNADGLVIVPTPGIPNTLGGPYPVSSGAMVAADIDNDGDKDLLVSWDPADIEDRQSVSSLQILVNQGGRVFADDTVARAGAPPQAGLPRQGVNEFLIDDFNSDGCPDLLFPTDADFTQGAGIWFNDCSGNFTPAAEYVLPKPGNSYIPLDYDGDGDIDLLSAHPRLLNYAGTAGCSPGEGGGSDYIDFAVLLNTSPVDTDVDGVSDIHDLFPNDPTEWFDADSDGIGDNADLDDDNDGIPDIWESGNGLNLRDASDANLDGDGDLLTNINEYLAGTDPRDSDTDGDGVPDGQDDFPLGFVDVPQGAFAFSFIERLALSGITAGCGGGNYCPENPVTRAQMAVFLERGMNGSGYGPPAATGNVFLDVGAGDFAASFIEQLFSDGITAGCGNNNYCPGAEVTRDQMAVFLLRAKYGSDYTPPSATGVFDDVDLGHWAVHWIEQLAAEGITAGCGNNNYCPTAPVTRDQMAVFLVRTFGL